MFRVTLYFDDLDTALNTVIGDVYSEVQDKYVAEKGQASTDDAELLEFAVKKHQYEHGNTNYIGYEVADLNK